MALRCLYMITELLTGVSWPVGGGFVVRSGSVSTQRRWVVRLNRGTLLERVILHSVVSFLVQQRGGPEQCGRRSLAHRLESGGGNV